MHFSPCSRLPVLWGYLILAFFFFPSFFHIFHIFRFFFPSFFLLPIPTSGHTVCRLYLLVRGSLRTPRCMHCGCARPGTVGTYTRPKGWDGLSLIAENWCSASVWGGREPTRVHLGRRIARECMPCLQAHSMVRMYASVFGVPGVQSVLDGLGALRSGCA